MSEANLIKLCAVRDVTESTPVRVAVEGRSPIAVFRIGKEFLLTDDECTHGKASLSEEGAVEGHLVVCSWHNCQFDLRTGEPLGLPCTLPLRTYTPIVKDDVIYFSGEPRPKAG